jgi:mediator of RNA polymerase II transcription subunit 14
MPGRIIMDQEGAIGSHDLKKDRSHAQQGAPPVQTPLAQVHPTSPANGLANGSHGAMPNGVAASGEPRPSMNGESSFATVSTRPDNPPELDQSWRDGDTNKSLGLLMDRVASQCYFDLNTTLTEMDAVPTEPQHHQANGIMAHTGQDASESSMKKKRLLMDWASTQRERFIKTLVLADWSRNEEDVSRLLDVKVWQDKQNFAHGNSTQSIANTKNNMIAAKMPNPNIEGAMEVLATAKASWVPHLGYIPPKRLTAKQLLKTLRNMNVILATRLNLHDDLPPHFTRFSIADGRATFTVKDEFEVDLSVADEDPATPFYFIDIRLSFSPSSEVINDRLRGFMERKINDDLGNKGLKGCYEFLHSFALTHKLNVLRSQASELIRGKWFDCIRIESFRRRLIVQYWAGMPGPKNWIEIGISSGRQRGYRSKPPTPRLVVRWFRKGVEVKDDTLEFDWRNLDLEKSLYLVIAKHTAWALNDVKSRIAGLAPKGSPFKADISKIESESQSDALFFSLPSLRQPLQVHIEPITGQFAILPPSQATWRTEQRLNSDASADAVKLLAALPPSAAQESFGKEAALIGWSPIENSTPLNDLKKAFSETVRHLSVFEPTSAWGESWALAVTFSLAGEKWWAVSLQNQTDHEGKVIGKHIVSASRVALPDAVGNTSMVCRETLLAVEKGAVTHVALSTTGKELKERQIPYSIEKLPRRSIGEQRRGLHTACNVALFVQFAALTKDSQNKSKKPLADEIVRLTHYGVTHTGENGRGPAGSVRHDLRLSLEPAKMKELQKHVSRSKDRDLVMNQDGGLAVKLLTPFGEPFVEQMQQRLRSIERLEGCLATLKERSYRCTHVTLSRLDFMYNKELELGATLTFSAGNDLHTRVKLTPPDSNPHQRIRVMLENGLNGAQDVRFQTFSHILAITLPVLRTFDQLEAKSPAKLAIAIHARTPLLYSVKYDSPLPSVSFQILAKTKTEGGNKLARWLVRDLKSGTKGGDLPEDLAKAVNEVWQETGEHWQGVGNGLIAEAQGVAAALGRLDGVIRRFPGAAEPSSAQPPDAVKQEEASKPSTTEEIKAKAPPANPAPPQNKSQAPAKGTASGGAGNKKRAEVVVLD